MSPVLLKPQTDRTSQLVVQGQVRETLSSGNFREGHGALIAEVLESYARRRAGMVPPPGQLIPAEAAWILGLCGGGLSEMLGRSVVDPLGIEGPASGGGGVGAARRGDGALFGEDASRGRW